MDKENGQILIFMIIGIIVLLGFIALTIDGGLYFVNQRQAQNAADSAALAGALAKHLEGDCKTQALDRAASNGFSEGNDVEIDVDCNYGEDGAYVYVIITTTSDAFLQGLIGNGKVTNRAEAEAYYHKGSEDVSRNLLDNALIVLDPTGKDSFSLSGNSTLITEGGGVFVNSSHNKAWTGSGNQTFNTDTGIHLVGGANLSGNITLNTDIIAGSTVKTSGKITLNGKILENQVVDAISYPPKELNIIAPIVTTPICSGTGTLTTSGNSITLTPGNHVGRTISGNYSINFEPGNYCFSGNLVISGNSTVMANNVNFNMGEEDISLSGNLTFNADSSLFFLNSGVFDMNGNAVINIPDSTVYLVSGDFNLNGNDSPSIRSDQTSIIYLGSGNIKLNGNSTFTSTNTVFYLREGSMRWNGNSVLVMDAPNEGDFAGLLIYMPYSNTSTLTINGNTGTLITGSIIAPGATVKVNGNSDSTCFNSRIIGYNFSFIGNTTFKVVFNEEENYVINGGDLSYIELVR